MSIVKFNNNNLVASLIEHELDKNIPNFVPSLFENVIANILQTPPKKCSYIFHTNMYVFYQIAGRYYVDINHVISNLTQKQSQYMETLRVFSNEIVYLVEPNNTNGTNDSNGTNGHARKRYLVSPDTMGRIVLAYKNRPNDFYNTFMMECYVYLSIINCLFS